jgi:site-specific recombinase XerD
MKYSVKFYLEKRKNKKTGLPIEYNVPIWASIFYSGNQVLYYTAKRCNLKQWDPDKMRIGKGYILPNGHNSTTFNADLNKVETAIDDLFKAYEVKNEVPDPSRLRSDLDKLIKSKKPITVEEVVPQKTFSERFKQYINDAPLSFERKKHMQTTLNKIKKFNQYTTFEIITTEYITKFQNYLNDKTKCNLAENTVISELRRLRAFLGYCVKNKWISSNPFKSFGIKSESYGDPVYLTIAERDFLFNASIEDEKLSRVRDLFVLQCFIGCRVGDFVKLRHENIIDGCIEYIAGKTKDEKPRIARVPLSAKAWEIINKYNLPSGDLVPYISGQKYNVYLKELFVKVELNRKVTIPDKKTRENKVVLISDIATSHMARRVFIGNLHSKAKNEVIASMSGHVANSLAFARYYTIEKQDQIEAIKFIE